MAAVLVAAWVANEGQEERIAALLSELRSHTLEEPGCLAYQPCRDRDDPRRFLIFEIYRDDDALQAHSESEHFRRLALGEAMPLLASRERTFYETID
jgi:quinol monooxygenase YgiN